MVFGSFHYLQKVSKRKLLEEPELTVNEEGGGGVLRSVCVC